MEELTMSPGPRFSKFTHGIFLAICGCGRLTAYCSPNYATGNENPRDVYGGNYERLAALKAKYDPNNIFNKYFPITPSSN